MKNARACCETKRHGENNGSMHVVVVEIVLIDEEGS